MQKNIIVPIVIHRVVESICIDFEDITLKSLKKITLKKKIKAVIPVHISGRASNISEIVFII